jgi:hypothetical protein
MRAQGMQLRGWGDRHDTSSPGPLAASLSLPECNFSFPSFSFVAFGPSPFESIRNNKSLGDGHRARKNRALLQLSLKRRRGRRELCVGSSMSPCHCWGAGQSPKYDVAIHPSAWPFIQRALAIEAMPSSLLQFSFPSVF